MASLPIFQPVEDLPALRSSEIALSASPTSTPGLLETEAACKAGETAHATRCINLLQQAHTPVELLHSCLTAAVESASEELVELLLSLGVPINSAVITSALQAANTSVLTLFLRHGWDLNHEEAWYVPPWLSLVCSLLPITIDCANRLQAWLLPPTLTAR